MLSCRAVKASEVKACRDLLLRSYLFYYILWICNVRDNCLARATTTVAQAAASARRQKRYGQLELASAAATAAQAAADAAADEAAAAQDEAMAYQASAVRPSTLAAPEIGRKPVRGRKRKRVY